MLETYPTSTIAEANGCTPQAVEKKLKRLGCPCEEKPGKGRGGKVKEWSYAGIPSDWQQGLVIWERDQSIGRIKSCTWPNPMAGGNGDKTTIQKDSSPGAPAVPVVVGVSREIIIPERSDKIGLAKYQLVKAWRDVVKAQPWGKKEEATQAFLLAYKTGRLLPGVYDLVGEITDKPLYRLDKLLRDSASGNNGHEDYRVLCDGRGGWRKHGTTKWQGRDLSEAAIEEFLCCWLQPEKPSVHISVLAAKNVLKKKGTPEDACEATFRRWLKDWEKKNQHVIGLAREGEKYYRDHVAPYITRDDGRLEVGQVLVADGHDCNFEILHPRTGKPCRMKLITFFDWASRMPVGCQLMPTESTVAIMAALRMAIVALGKIPQAVYLDNGKAFKSKIFTETNPDLTELMGIYARLGIATAFAQPYNARAKLVERFFRTLSEQFEVFMPTSTGACIDKKPAWRARNEKFHQTWHQAKTEGWVPNVREAAYMLGQFTRWYGEQPHDGLGGKHPLDVLEAGRGPGVDLSELNWNFLWRKKVRPDRCRIRLYNIDYESDCLHGWGEDVYAMHDMNNLALVYLYDLDGRFLGEALPVQAMNPLAKLFGDQVGMDQVKAELTRHRRLAKQTKANLIELGATQEDVEALKGLPWNQRVQIPLKGAVDGSADGGSSESGSAPVKLLGRGVEDDLLLVDDDDFEIVNTVSSGDETPDSGELSASDLESASDSGAAADAEVIERSEGAAPDPPGADAEDERPWFGNDTDRYIWCCERMIAGKPISGSDEELVEEYEADPQSCVTVRMMRSKMESAASMRGRDGR